MAQNDHKNFPEKGKEKFACPHCGTVAKQDWTNVVEIFRAITGILRHIYLEYRSHVGEFAQGNIKDFLEHVSRNDALFPRYFVPHKFAFSTCQSCSNTAVWHHEERIYPRSSGLPDPNSDLDEDTRQLYSEAALIFGDSPRASAALLRLCLEQLCKRITKEESDLNTCIQKLVDEGLDKRIQQALDYCRITGNRAIHHPGEIDLTQDTSNVRMLFDLVNDIAQELITKPREMEEKYSQLPEGAKEQIAVRDSN